MARSSRRPEPPERPCKNCETLFRPRRPWSEYCSRRCGSQYRNRKAANYSLSLPGPKVSLIARLIVRADLERKGFDTFEGANGLIAAQGSKTVRVAVRVGRIQNYKLRFQPLEAGDPSELLAVVVFSHLSQEIHYNPEA